MHDYLLSTEVIRFAFVFGVAVSMLMYARRHLTTGSIVVPGYIAVFIVYPLIIVATFVNAALSYLAVNKVLRRWFLLYGRTKFTVLALISIVIQTLMLKLTQELFGSSDPDVTRSFEMQDFMEVVLDFERYFEELTVARRKEPTDDVASLIANARIDGEQIPQHETNGYYIIVATAGHDTTSSSTSGGLLALLQNPEQLERLRAEPVFAEKLGRLVGHLVDLRLHTRALLRAVAGGLQRTRERRLLSVRRSRAEGEAEPHSGA